MRRWCTYGFSCRPRPALGPSIVSIELSLRGVVFNGRSGIAHDRTTTHLRFVILVGGLHSALAVAVGLPRLSDNAAPSAARAEERDGVETMMGAESRLRDFGPPGRKRKGGMDRGHGPPRSR